MLERGIIYAGVSTDDQATSKMAGDLIPLREIKPGVYIGITIHPENHQSHIWRFPQCWHRHLRVVHFARIRCAMNLLATLISSGFIGLFVLVILDRVAPELKTQGRERVAWALFVGVVVLVVITVWQFAGLDNAL